MVQVRKHTGLRNAFVGNSLGMPPVILLEELEHLARKRETWESLLEVLPLQMDG